MRILIVSTSRPDSSVISALISLSHFVNYSDRCEDAEELVRREAYDAAIIYLFFENLSSLELIGRIKSYSPSTRILTTGEEPNSRSEETAKLFDVQAHLPQPLDPATLIPALESFSFAKSNPK